MSKSITFTESSTVFFKQPAIRLKTLFNGWSDTQSATVKEDFKVTFDTFNRPKAYSQSFSDTHPPTTVTPDYTVTFSTYDKPKSYTSNITDNHPLTAVKQDFTVTFSRRTV